MLKRVGRKEWNEDEPSKRERLAEISTTELVSPEIAGEAVRYLMLQGKQQSARDDGLNHGSLRSAAPVHQ